MSNQLKRLLIGKKRSYLVSYNYKAYDGCLGFGQTTISFSGKWDINKTDQLNQVKDIIKKYDSTIDTVAIVSMFKTIL